MNSILELQEQIISEINPLYSMLELRDVLNYAQTLDNFKSYSDDRISKNNIEIAELLNNHLITLMNELEDSKHVNLISKAFKIVSQFLKVENSNTLTHDEVKDNPLVLSIWNDNNSIDYIADKIKSSHDLFTQFIAYELEGKYLKTPFDEVFNSTMDKIFSGEIKRLIINIPMGYGKTFRATIITSLRAYAIQSKSKIIHISYDSTLAQLNSQTIREIITKSSLYRKLYPNVILTDDTKAKGLWKTANGGVFRAVSSGSGITGFRAGNISISGFGGLMIIDDPLKPDDALSNTKREFVNNRYETTFKSRLAFESVPIVVIMQRLHEKDFTNHLITRYSNEWYLLKIPALFDGDNKTEHAINISIEKYFKYNYSTWEDKYQTTYLLKEKQVNPNYFYTQLQQNPINLSDSKILNGDWIVTDSIKNYNINQVFITADTAMKTNEYNDYSVFSIFGLTTDKKLYLIDILRVKLEFHNLINAFEDFHNKYNRVIKPLYRLPNISQIYIEDKASGTPLIQVLRNKGYIVNAVPRNKDKLFRVSNVSFLLAQGYLITSPNLILLEDIKREFNEFTSDDSHKHDDIIDTIIDALEIKIIPNYELTNKKLNKVDNLIMY